MTVRLIDLLDKKMRETTKEIYKMKEKVEMPSNERIRAVARKCPVAEEVLKGLFPEAFEKKEIEIELEDGQIYKTTTFQINYYLLVKSGDGCWKLTSVSELGHYWGGWQSENNMKYSIQTYFTLCPHATITVKENER